MKKDPRTEKPPLPPTKDQTKDQTKDHTKAQTKPQTKPLASAPMAPMKPGARLEARREKRKTIDINATVSVEGRVVVAQTRDISRLGLCLVSDTEIPRNTDLEIRVVLSLGESNMSEPLLLSGRAAWCTALFGKYQVGVMFVDLDANQYRFLDLFMRFIAGEVRPAGYDPGPDPAPPERPEDKDDPFRG